MQKAIKIFILSSFTFGSVFCWMCFADHYKITPFRIALKGWFTKNTSCVYMKEFSGLIQMVYDRVWGQGCISRQWDFMVKNVKLSSCQVVKLSSCQVVRLSGCQVVKLSGCQVVRLSSLILGACWTTSVLMSMLRSQCLLVKMVMVFWGPQQQHTPDPLTLEFIELAGSQLKPIVQM